MVPVRVGRNTAMLCGAASLVLVLAACSTGPPSEKTSPYSQSDVEAIAKAFSSAGGIPRADSPDYEKEAAAVQPRSCADLGLLPTAPFTAAEVHDIRDYASTVNIGEKYLQFRAFVSPAAASQFERRLNQELDRCRSWSQGGGQYDLVGQASAENSGGWSVVARDWYTFDSLKSFKKWRGDPSNASGQDAPIPSVLSYLVRGNLLIVADTPDRFDIADLISTANSALSKR